MLIRIAKTYLGAALSIMRNPKLHNVRANCHSAAWHSLRDETVAVGFANFDHIALVVPLVVVYQFWR